ncbi:MAG: hypothetical protein ACE5FT_05440 [Candidatus Nanoarchaeia archaeon]
MDQEMFANLGYSSTNRSYSAGVCKIDFAETGVGDRVVIKQAKDNPRNPYIHIASARALQREIEVLQQYQSERPKMPIPLVFDACMDSPYLITEEITGVPVTKWLGPKPALWKIIFSSRETSRALAALHKKGLAHRDVHSSNFIISATKTYGFNVLPIDFATAATIEDIKQGKAINHDSPFYAPERMTFDYQKDPNPCADDVYAVGMDLLCTITGTNYLEFRDPNGMIAYHKVYLKLAEATRTGGPLDNDLGLLVSTMTDIDRHNRPSMEEAVIALDILLEAYFSEFVQAFLID